jgi:hypothetical protein
MNDELLKQGPREAPEPETAEERSSRTGLKTAGVSTAARIGGWIGILLIAAIVVGGVMLYRRRHA